MNRNDQRQGRSRHALPPIGRRPVVTMTTSAATTMPQSAPKDGGNPRLSESGPARLLIGAHLLLLIQSSLIVFSAVELGAARIGIAAITAASAAALIWAAIERLRRPSRISRRQHHDA